MTTQRYVINLPKAMNKVEIQDYDKSLLFRLGGEDALEAVLEMFISAILEDDFLLPFFDNVHPAVLKVHQKRFLALAFTEIPSDFDAKAFLIERHYRLFAKGLNETHFDRVAIHLESALNGMWVEPKLIAEVKERVVPLRAIFEEEGRKHVTEYLREKVGSTSHLNAVEGQSKKLAVA